jgi:glycosyltransferase involved in cell wall biosynthesis
MRIGIATLSYNQGQWLEEALESIHSWQKNPVDHVIVDPGSTDGSRSIIERNRHRCAGVLLDPDSGPADGLNKALALLNTPVFGYLNADDRFCPYALDYVSEYFSMHPDCDVLLGAIRVVRADGTAHYRIRRPDLFDVRNHVYGTCFVYQQATFFRSRIFRSSKGFNTNNRSCWDSELLVDLSLDGARFEYTDKLLGDFRLYPYSLTGSGAIRKALGVDMRRIRDSALKKGISPMGSIEQAVRKCAYKFNPKRHISYLLYSAPPRFQG